MKKLLNIAAMNLLSGEPPKSNQLEVDTKPESFEERACRIAVEATNNLLLEFTGNGCLIGGIEHLIIEVNRLRDNAKLPIIRSSTLIELAKKSNIDNYETSAIIKLPITQSKVVRDIRTTRTNY